MFGGAVQVLQTALTHAVMGGVAKYTQIQQVILAEVPSMPVQHAPAVRFLLSSIAPSAQITELSLLKKWTAVSTRSSVGAL